VIFDDNSGIGVGASNTFDYRRAFGRVHEIHHILKLLPAIGGFIDMALLIGYGVVRGIVIKNAVDILLRDGLIDFIVNPLQLLLCSGYFIRCRTCRRGEADR
jgi:hypothetical protein